MPDIQIYHEEDPQIYQLWADVRRVGYGFIGDICSHLPYFCQEAYISFIFKTRVLNYYYPQMGVLTSGANIPLVRWFNRKLKTWEDLQYISVSANYRLYLNNPSGFYISFTYRTPCRQIIEDVRAIDPQVRGLKIFPGRHKNEKQGAPQEYIFSEHQYEPDGSICMYNMVRRFSWHKMVYWEILA